MFKFYAYAIVAGFLGALGDIFLNQGLKEAQVGKGWWFLAGFVVWNASLVCFMIVLRSNQLAAAVVVFLIANCIIVLLTSQVWFKEPLSAVQWLSIAIGMVAMIGMELGKR